MARQASLVKHHRIASLARRLRLVGPLVVFLLWGQLGPTLAQCAVPYQFTNATTADATHVMANFDALLSCINTVPAGATNAFQYNAGHGLFGGTGPPSDGQLVIGSTG